MRHLYLHVGMHKTGSSAIQASLAACPDALAAGGYAYLQAARNHSAILHTAFSPTPGKLGVLRRRGLVAPGDIAVETRRSRRGLHEFLAFGTAPRLVLSGEEASRLGPEGVRAMLEFCRRRVDRVTVIAFVRPPRSFAVSAAQQQIRGGQPIGKLGPRLVPEYRRRFEPFLQSADLAETRLRLYARDQLVNGCSVATFLAMCDAPPEFAAGIPVQAANPALSRPAVLLLAAANEAMPAALPDGSPNPARGKRMAALLRGLPGPRFGIPDAVVARMLRDSGAEADIAWMEARLGLSFAAFEPPVPEAAVAAAPPLTAWLRTEFDRLPWAELRPLAERLAALG